MNQIGGRFLLEIKCNNFFYVYINLEYRCIYFYSILLESTKYYRDDDGFVYRKTGENGRTIYLDCLNAPNCLAGARIVKEGNEVLKLGNHTDQKPDEHFAMKIAFEALLKIEARKQENESVSVLNLYKRAIKNNSGLWLPIGHQQTFLVKLRRIRKYEKERKKTQRLNVRRGAIPNMVDVGTSPTPPITSPRMTRSQTKSAAKTTPRTPAPRKAKTNAMKTSATIEKGGKKTASTSTSASREKKSIVKTPQNSSQSPSESVSLNDRHAITPDLSKNPSDLAAKVTPNIFSTIIHFYSI